MTNSGGEDGGSAWATSRNLSQLTVSYNYASHVRSTANGLSGASDVACDQRWWRRTVIFETGAHQVQATMSKERLEALMFCVVETYILKSLTTAYLVAKFAAASDRRLELG